MIDTNTIALLVCLDSNTKKNLYEYEFIKCIQYWKKNSGFLKDIDIYVYIPKNTVLSAQTLTFLRNTDHINVQQYSASFKYLFINTLYCQYLFEVQFKNRYNYSIYIDLDMYLQKMLPTTLFNNKTVLTYYELNKIENQPNLTYRIIKNLNNNILTFNTYFIINFLQNQLFEQLFSFVNNNEYKNIFTESYLVDNDWYFFEECIYDYAYKLGIINNINCRFLHTGIVSNSKNSYFKHIHIPFVRDQLTTLLKRKNYDN